jgi:hypothetical protein
MEASMLDTMTRYLEGVMPKKNAFSLRRILHPTIDRLSSQPLTSAGLVISATTTLAKIGAADFYASVAGDLVKIAAGTNMPSLVGFNFAAGNWNVACFYVDGAGVVTMLPGSQGATLAGVTFPEPPKNKALVGFLIVTYASAFTGGTTVLSTATTVYVSPLGAFDPTALTG